MAFSESVFNFIKDYIDAKVQTAIKQALAQDGNSTIEIKEYEIKSYGEPVYIKIPTYVTPSGISSQLFRGYNQNGQSSGFVFTGSDGNLYSYVVPDGVQILTTEDGRPYFINDEGRIVYVLLPNNNASGSNGTSNGSVNESTDKENGTIAGGNGGEVTPECAKYFENININARDIAIPGYTIEYMPSEPIKKDTEYTYTVHAVVTHNKSGCTKTYSFEETTYPDGVQIDKYGRTVIQYDEAEPTNCVDRAILRYARKNAVLLVKPKETEADKVVADLYKTVLKRTLIDSEGMEYWVGEYNSGKYTIDELKRKMALETPNIKGLEEVSYFARAYLFSIGEEGYDAGGRYVIDICEVPDSPCRRAILDPELKNVFVAGDGSEKDNMIENAYKEVLDRNYVDARGFVSWRKVLEENNLTYDQLKENIATAALEYLKTGRCIPNIYDAYIYLHPYDKYGRKYIKMTKIPQTECWRYAINQKNPEIFNFVEPNKNDDIDKSIAQAYKQVLGRDYIESKSFQYWYEYVKNNEPTFNQLCQAIAQAAIESTTDCPEAKERAKQWLQTGTFDIFGDGSAVAFYQFEGNANDAGGVYNGKWHGNEQYDEGVLGKAAKFDGGSSIVLDTKVSSYREKTISLWFKSLNPTDSTIEGIYQEAIREDYPYNGVQLWNGYYNSNITIRTRAGNETKVCSKNDVSDNFGHFAMVYTTSGLKCYFNGVLKVTIDDTTDLTDLIDNVVLGGNFNVPSNQSLNGLIDQVRIFSRPLSGNEVKQLYHEGRPIYKKSTINKLDVFDDNSCIATYTFDNETAEDLSGKYNGTWKGTETYDIGKIGKAAKFDGNSQIMVNPNLDNDGTVTLSFWIKIPTYSSDEDYGVFTTGDYEENSTFRLNLYKGNADFQYGAGGQLVYSEDYKSWVGNWVHLVVSFSPTKWGIYKNGQLLDNGTVSHTLNHKNKLHIGYSQWYFNGLIDQVRIFNRALTEDEVKKLYEEGRS